MCSATDAYHQRKRSLADLNQQITEKENLLATGYRVYESCQLVTVTVPAKTVDCTGLSDSALQNCLKANTPATNETRRVCRQVPVPIDYSYEMGALSDLRMARESQLEYHEMETDDCRARARSLSPEKAYLLYKDNAAP
ncbi:MAG: hypothetical protein R3E50_03175 [Halioglobus sp.]